MRGLGGMFVKEVVYLKMKKHVRKFSRELITLKDIAHINYKEKELSNIEQIPIYKITEEDHNIVVIDYFVIVRLLAKQFPEKDFQLIGEPYSIIKIEEAKKEQPIFIIVFVWLLLFIGTAMTIMNFHYDVSMLEVHQKLHLIITGNEEQLPLFIQIPYSIGLGFGMLLFFNHWFKKKFTDEPSPLEIELHNYQKNIDNYVINYENILNDD